MPVENDFPRIDGAYDVIVVGGGAAGLIAAWRVALAGRRVLLLEKTRRLGTKILISGGGKCNITHDGPIEDLLRAFRPSEARFLRPACYRFSNQDLLRELHASGLETFTREDGRVFPVSRVARDVVQKLEGWVRAARAEIALEAAVSGLLFEAGKCVGARVGQNALRSAAVVLATGGSSYPKSGTTGDGWDWAVEAGHTLRPVLAALAPIDLVEPKRDWTGIAIRDVSLEARAQGKRFAKRRGDLLYTHRGVSGPPVLEISREVAERLCSSPEFQVELRADLAPETSFEQLSGDLRSWLAANPNKRAETWFQTYLPSRLAEHAGSQFGEGPWSRAGKKLWNRAVESVKSWPIGFVAKVPLDLGEVVAGGIELGEVDPQTMRSLVCPGLFLCGEVLDVAGPVGGYNLQAAFATGYLAGESAARA